MKWPAALFISTALISIAAVIVLTNKAPDYVEVQKKAIDSIRLELELKGESCFVNWETGEVWGRLDLNKHSLVRCNINTAKKLKTEIVELLKATLEPLKRL